MRSQIVILSLPRSGSSLTARILKNLGVDFGSNLQLPDEMNPDGYIEDRDLKRINKWIRNSADIKNLSERMHAVVNSKGDISGFKNPDMCYTLDYWVEHMPEMKIIHLQRNRNNVIRSFSKYDVYRDVAEELLKDWSNQKQLSLMNALMMGIPIHNVSYEKLTSDPATEVKRMAEFCDVPYKEESHKEVRIL